MSEWQPIKTAPKDDTYFLAARLYLDGDCTMDIVKFAYEENGVPRFQPDGLPSGTYSHWMPLPEPPK